MPLTKSVPRRLIHTREIRCHGYRRDDGLWDIEAALVDTKTYSFDNMDRGGIGAGEPVHGMLIRLTVDDELVVHGAEAATDFGPHFICGDVTSRFAVLKGLRIGPGWRKAVLERMGRVKGCTHLTDLLIGPLAVTAFQTLAQVRRERDGKRPAGGEACFA